MRSRAAAPTSTCRSSTRSTRPSPRRCSRCVRLLSFGGHGHHFPLQFAAALGVLAVTLLLTRRALAQDLPLWPVAIWAWCPITMIELVNNAHIDWLGVLLSVLALTVAARGRMRLGGRAGRRGVHHQALSRIDRRRAAASTAVCRWSVRPWRPRSLVYVPHVIAVGQHVLGFLPSYLDNGGYGSGKQYRLLSFWLPSSWQTPAAAVLVVVVLVLRYRALGSRPPRAGGPDRGRRRDDRRRPRPCPGTPCCCSRWRP